MNLLRFESTETWVDGLVAFWEARLRAKPDLRHCLPAGGTPLPIYAAMASAVASGSSSFADAEIFALDEYGGLPPNDPGTCASVLKRSLIERIDLPADRFQHFDPHRVDMHSHLAAYEQAIGPGFDLTLLGIGLNGHLGLNEPGSAADSPIRRVAMHSSSTQAAAQYVKSAPLPTWGLTIGLKHLLSSKEVWLLATGAAKAEVVRRLVRDKPTPELPASLMQRHPRCYLFLDADAARLL